MARLKREKRVEGAAVERHEEELVGVEGVWRGAGYVRARKKVDRERFDRRVPFDREELELERVPTEEGDSGEIETLEDGSISIPIYEEEVVVSKRVVLRERVVIRKRVVTEQRRVRTKLRKERVEIDADPGVEVTTDPPADTTA